jgi:hypothetical protein
MKVVCVAMVTAVTSLALCASAKAYVITFDAAASSDGTSGYTSTPISSPYVENIFSVSAPSGLYYLGWGDGRYAGLPNLFDSNYDSVTTLKTTTGQDFNLNSIDLAVLGGYPPPALQATTFTGELANGGTVTETFDVTNTQFQTYTLSPSFSDLKSVSWTAPSDQGTPQFAMIDVTAVPEPSTWATLLLGFAGLGLVGYRKARKAGAAALAM